MEEKTVYEQIADERRKRGFKPECDFCGNTGYRKDYMVKKLCTKCYSVNEASNWIDRIALGLPKNTGA